MYGNLCVPPGLMQVNTLEYSMIISLLPPRALVEGWASSLDSQGELYEPSALPSDWPPSSSHSTCKFNGCVSVSGGEKQDG